MLTVTEFRNANFLTMEYSTQYIVALLIKDCRLEVDEAINIFYKSVVFEKLHEEETGLYLEGALYIL